jgi:hypothetical protein
MEAPRDLGMRVPRPLYFKNAPHEVLEMKLSKIDINLLLDFAVNLGLRFV